MVDININFLKNEAIKQKKIAKKKKMVLFSFVSMVGLYLLVVLGFFAYSLILTTKSKNIIAKIDTAETQVRSRQDLELMTILLAKKTDSLGIILTNQKRHQQITDYFFSILPAGVSVQGFEISSENNLSFSGKADSLKSLKTFFDNIINKQSDILVISKASIGGLSARTDLNSGAVGYNFSVVLSFLE